METGNPRDRGIRRPWSALVRYGFVPTMLVGIDGGAIALAFHGAPKASVAAVVLLAACIARLAEFVAPHSDDWNRDRGDGARDIVHAIVNEVLAIGSVAAVPVLVPASPFAAAWPHQWPFVAQVLFAMIVADLGITLAHRTSHHVGWMWRLHAVHHSVKRFYGWNGLVKHPLHQAIETVAGVTPLLVLGLPEGVATALAACVATQLLLQHSNVDYRVGPLSRWLALNEAHRLHHRKWPGIGDVNFGLFTLLWDRCLGTFEPGDGVRLTSEDLGIGDRPDFPSGYLAQAIEPFRRASR